MLFCVLPHRCAVLFCHTTLYYVVFCNNVLCSVTQRCAVLWSIRKRCVVFSLRCAVLCWVTQSLYYVVIVTLCCVLAHSVCSIVFCHTMLLYCVLSHTIVLYCFLSHCVMLNCVLSHCVVLYYVVTILCPAYRIELGFIVLCCRVLRSVTMFCDVCVLLQCGVT